jgi:hypothetical protein
MGLSSSWAEEELSFHWIAKLSGKKMRKKDLENVVFRLVIVALPGWPISWTSAAPWSSIHMSGIPVLLNSF